MQTIHIKIDGAFPDRFSTGELHRLLESGWHILDKTIIKDRYILYVLADKADSDVGKCSYGTEANNLASN